MPHLDFRSSLPARAPGQRTRRGFGVASLAVISALSLGCASYKGSATAAQPSVVANDGDWMMVPHFPLVQQTDTKDCGAAALAAVLRFWGFAATPESIETGLGKKNARLEAGAMEAYARGLGLKSYVFYGTMKDVVHELGKGRPIIVGLGKVVEAKKALSHYEVVVGYEPKKKQVLLLDPGRGWQTDSLEGFAHEWALSKGVTMVAFLPEGDPRSSAR